MARPIVLSQPYNQQTSSPPAGKEALTDPAGQHQNWKQTYSGQSHTGSARFVVEGGGNGENHTQHTGDHRRDRDGGGQIP